MAKNKPIDKVASSTGDSKASARLTALNWLTLVVKQGRSVNDILQSSGSREMQSSDKINSSELAFAKQMLFGSLRYFHQLKAIVDQLIEKPLKDKDRDVYSIIILGIYQLRYMLVPDHAALSESVELTRKIKKPWAAGLVNGILRNYQRQKLTIESRLRKAKTYQFSHPNWIINQLEADWGEAYSGILEQNNQRAAMIIRVNQLKNSLQDYRNQLDNQGIATHLHPLAKDALILQSPCDVAKLPGFFDGLVTVQDAAPQLVADLLDLHPEEKQKNQALRVLDGCAAPGGKTTHILQRNPNVILTSVEMSSSRMQRIESTLQRMDMQDNFHCELKCADILATNDWWDGELFDRVLIDVPCSASGVIRRNPDIKLHRKKQDLESIVQLQSEILMTAWRLLKPGGRLVYATCSIFKKENEDQIMNFLAKHTANRVDIPDEHLTGLSNPSGIGLQILPGELQMDGFYLCGLEKPIL